MPGIDPDDMKRTVLFTTSLLLLGLGGCILTDKQIGDGEDEVASNDSTGESGNDTGEDSDGGEGPFDECEGPFPSQASDQDCDEVGIACDNARDHRNPNQLDQDDDMFGDVADLCPLLAGDNNTADSDRDGIGNACDLCPKVPTHYNVFGPEVAAYMGVRNIPNHDDFDQDGVGDACDNCVTVPNCQDFGPGNPAPFGAEAGEGANCQLDEDADGIGDACEAELPSPPNTAGPIGLANDDDLDQDGVRNVEDGCPRVRVSATVCTSDLDCEAGADCALAPTLGGDRVCDHVDADNDNVGDVCDTCPAIVNPMQVTDGGMQVDDEDADFIGRDCETNVECSVHPDARPIAFYDVSAGGYCCVATYPGDDALHDPDGAPIQLTCTSEQEDDGICRKPPAAAMAMPGVVELPLGCTAALADAGVDEATALTLGSEGIDGVVELWSAVCMLPPHDQDFDGVGDACDLCPFAHDPFNEPYVDGQGSLWPDIGRFCAGAYAPELVPGAACEWP